MALQLQYHSKFATPACRFPSTAPPSIFPTTAAIPGKSKTTTNAVAIGGATFRGIRPRQSFTCFSALSPELKTTIDKVVTSQKIVVFIKGTKEFPQCGFSNTVVQILRSLNAPFETINILENEVVRQGLKEYSSWPTFPQIYIDGDLFGGCDIIVGKSTAYSLLLKRSNLSQNHH